MAPPVRVAEYYAGKTVFITGATGFMGKVLLEKLLRSCPDIKKVYIIMRAKKGKNSKERLEELINLRVFERIHKEQPKFYTKIHLICGDILKKGMDMSAEDRALLIKDTNIIFHCAACVRFDQDLKNAVNLNTGGTHQILQLAEDMKGLEAFVHVSTAYCRCDLGTLEEKIYRTTHNPQKVLECVEWMDDELLEHLEKKIIYPQPNTYAYTKSLTEDLVAQYEGKFPIAIARPSIVVASMKEPMPGWVDNINGPTGIIVGAGKGVIRSMICHDEKKADLIPVDMLVNGCIILAYLTGLHKFKKIHVVNMSESGQNPITWKRGLEIGRNLMDEFPFSLTLWYPGGSPKTSWIHHKLAVFFTHIIPAYLIDLLLILLGKKTFMVHIQKRVSSGLEVLQFYTTKEWHFKNENFLQLKQQVSKEDNEVFFTDIKALNWDSYMRDYIKGAREFCVKDPPSTLPRSRVIMKRLYYLDRGVKVIFTCFVLYMLYTYALIVFKML